MQSPMLPTLVSLQSIKKETHDTFTLRFDGSAFPNQGKFLPGQFNMLYVFGVGEVPISVSGDAEKPSHYLHTIRDVGMVTEALCTLRPGAQIGVRGPYGSHWPVERAKGKDVLLIAGGVGLAPLRPVIYHLLNHRADFQNVSILYGARSPEELLFTEELAKWKKRADLHLAVTVDRAMPGWYGRLGLVTTLLSGIKFDPANGLAMLCGPEVMMRFGARDLLQRGVPQESIYVSLERSMKCGIGLCGHCQLGPFFVCKDGPVHRYDTVNWMINQRDF